MTAADLLIPLSVLAASFFGGIVIAWWRSRRAEGAEQAVARGRVLTVPMLVAVSGANRRAYGVVDEQSLRVIGPSTHLVISGPEYLSASRGQLRVDEDSAEVSLQRAYVDAAGAGYLVGPVEDWDQALTTALRTGTAPASRLRLWLAAVPRSVAGICALAALGLLGSQLIWATGHDVSATMVRLVGEKGLESCGVRWSEQGRTEYAEVDCYAPFPAVGSPLVVHALAWPFDESAMDNEGSYEGLTVIFGGATLILGVAAVIVAFVRWRRPPIRLSARIAPTLHEAALPPPPAPSLTSASASAPGGSLALPELIATLAAAEVWEDGVTDPPSHRAHDSILTAAFSARWWPVLVLGGVGFIPDLPSWLPLVLWVASAAAAAWALYISVGTWLALRRAESGPVTSEWDYRLVRNFGDEWEMLLFLGQQPHWVTWLGGPGHPAPAGRCGIRGDLEEGGAVQLRIGDTFWQPAGPIFRVDDALASEIRTDLLDRLAALGRLRPGPDA